ncbi:hypothetical protein LG201_04490 [Methylobacillus gramineus]|uniref:hypothetical protein n=1 Tax=Methylobacillus gramineus TaxID=755169 RepID=UPI001CFF7BB0|nr:hypothetical protein [Methylobacillus gramineus]MCB5184456.1 hypothetical protein [Methylobacillus gramineus]
MQKILEILQRIDKGETTFQPRNIDADMVQFQVDVICLQQAHKQGLISQPWFIVSTSGNHPSQIEKVSMLRLTDLGKKLLLLHNASTEPDFDHTQPSSY